MLDDRSGEWRVATVQSMRSDRHGNNWVSMRFDGDEATQLVSTHCPDGEEHDWVKEDEPATCGDCGEETVWWCFNSECCGRCCGVDPAVRAAPLLLWLPTTSRRLLPYKSRTCLHGFSVGQFVDVWKQSAVGEPCEACFFAVDDDDDAGAGPDGRSGQWLPANPAIRVGSVVEARKRRKGGGRSNAWWKADVFAVHPDATVDVRFQQGRTVERRVPRSAVRLTPALVAGLRFARSPGLKLPSDLLGAAYSEAGRSAAEGQTPALRPAKRSRKSWPQQRTRN